MTKQQNKLLRGIGICGVATTIVLGGCASSPDHTEAVKERMEIEKMQRQLEAKRKEEREKRLQEQVDTLPAWVTEKPKPDSSGLYGVGVARSTDLTAALDKSSLKADFEIAQQFKQQMSGLSKGYINDRNGLSSQEFEQAVERFVSAVDMSGQQIVKQDISVVDGKYSSAVLSYLSFDRMEHMLFQQDKLQGSDQMEQAFEELRERVKEDQQANASAAVSSVEGDSISKANEDNADNEDSAGNEDG